MTQTLPIPAGQPKEATRKAAGHAGAPAVAVQAAASITLAALLWPLIPAAHLGCLVASGVAPYRAPGRAAVTGQSRYQELAHRCGPVVAGLEELLDGHLLGRIAPQFSRPIV